MNNIDDSVDDLDELQIKEFIDEMYILAFGASETRHEFTLEEVQTELLKRSNEHYKESTDENYYPCKST